MKTIFVILINIVCLQASAYDVAVENDDHVTIYYNFINDGESLEVAYNSDAQYSGDIVIPANVVYDGLQYDVERIGPYAFYSQNIISVLLPDGLKAIGFSAFARCSQLSSINIPGSVTYIDENAFWDCGNLPIENSLRYADTYLVGVTDPFCSEYTIKEGTRFIGDNAFSSCSSLLSMTIPNGVISIGSKAFDGCNTLSALTIPDGVTSIGYRAFTGCVSLSTLYIPNSVESIGSTAFANTGLTSIHLSENLTSLQDQLFSYSSNLTSIVIPERVTTIGERVFGDCLNLKTVEMQEGLTTIGNFAFANCINLESINIPSSVTKIDEGCFRGCSNLPVENNIRYADTYLVEVIDKSCSDYIIKEGTRFIGDLAFNYSSIKSINLPDSVISIGYSAFSGCYGLSSITFPNCLMTVGEHAFSYCQSLKTIDFPNSVKSIGPRAFVSSGLTSFTVPPQVTCIESGLFRSCKNLTSVMIHDGVTNIKDYAFYNCSSLESLIIPNSVTNIESYAFCCAKLTSMKLSDSLETISEGLFMSCDKLVSIYIPASVTTIESLAFCDCTCLSSISIPESVSAIGLGVFFGCSNLMDVTNFSTTPQEIDEDTFSVYGTLHVPDGCKSVYEGANYWYKFEIVEDALSSIEEIRFEESLPVSSTSPSSGVSDIYDLSGKKLLHPQHGINILRMSDGTYRKILVK